MMVAIEQPAFGHVRVANELRKRGLRSRLRACAVCGCGMTWRRRRSGSRRWKPRAAQEGLVLTEAQVAALEKAKAEKEARGEFESEHPGYCGAAVALGIGGLAPGAIYAAVPHTGPVPSAASPTIGLVQQASSLGQFADPAALGLGSSPSAGMPHPPFWRRPFWSGSPAHSRPDAFSPPPNSELAASGAHVRTAGLPPRLSL
jgi:hypothetical protein